MIYLLSTSYQCTLLQNDMFTYLHVYDSLLLYAHAVQALFNETNDPSILTNGKRVWNKMRRLRFEGFE